MLCLSTPLKKLDLCTPLMRYLHKSLLSCKYTKKPHPDFQPYFMNMVLIWPKGEIMEIVVAQCIIQNKIIGSFLSHDLDAYKDLIKSQLLVRKLFINYQLIDLGPGKRFTFSFSATKVTQAKKSQGHIKGQVTIMYGNHKNSIFRLVIWVTLLKLYIKNNQNYQNSSSFIDAILEFLSYSQIVQYTKIYIQFVPGVSFISMK